jgi:hypothetical protein
MFLFQLIELALCKGCLPIFVRFEGSEAEKRGEDTYCEGCGMCWK